MKRTIQKIATGTALTLSLTLMQIMPVLAVTEDEVAAHGNGSYCGQYLYLVFVCHRIFKNQSED